MTTTSSWRWRAVILLALVTINVALCETLYRTVVALNSADVRFVKTTAVPTEGLMRYDGDEENLRKTNVN